jgi:hypothetical protein
MKPMLGGELRREDQRLSCTRVCVDRDGTVDDLIEGFIVCLSPLAPWRPEFHVRRDPVQQAHADQRPRSGWSKPRIVEISGTLYLYAKQL